MLAVRNLHAVLHYIVRGLAAWRRASGLAVKSRKCVVMSSMDDQGDRRRLVDRIPSFADAVATGVAR